MKYISLITLLLFTLAAPLAAQQGKEKPIEGELIEGELGVVQDETSEESLEDGSAEEGSLDADIEALKKEVLSLNRDLFILEEDLLFPANTSSAFSCRWMPAPCSASIRYSSRSTIKMLPTTCIPSASWRH